MYSLETIIVTYNDDNGNRDVDMIFPDPVQLLWFYLRLIW